MTDIYKRSDIYSACVR